MKIGDTITIVCRRDSREVFLFSTKVVGTRPNEILVQVGQHLWPRAARHEGISWLRGDQTETPSGRALLTAAVLGEADRSAS